MYAKSTFRYLDSDVPVIDALSLTIEQNRTTAFVGSSGAGKSTLLDLILGLLEPTSGSIECGGRSILDDRATWYAGLGVVPQDVYLVNDSLKANVAFGIEPRAHRYRPSPRGRRARAAGRPGRRDARRLGHARRRARRPPLRRSAPANRARARAVPGARRSSCSTRRRPRSTTPPSARSPRRSRSLNGSLTIIIVAHRLSTVRNADRLVFLKDGRIEAEGTFAELRANSAEFSRLVELGDLS